MFCPSCGFEYTHKTNYCKRCGGDLNGAPLSPGSATPRFHAVGMFTVVALFGLVGLFLNLLSYHFLIGNGRLSSGDAILTFALGMMLVIGIAGVLARQMSRLITAYQKINESPPQDRVIIREIQAPHPGAIPGSISSSIPGAGEPSSVVEHTTRSMAGAYVEPKSTR